MAPPRARRGRLVGLPHSYHLSVEPLLAGGTPSRRQEGGRRRSPQHPGSGVAYPQTSRSLPRPRPLALPRAYHLPRMRAGIWLSLALLARLPVGDEIIEVEPAVVGEEMGIPEPTVRSWLGHLRKAGYVAADRLNGTVRVTIKKGFVPE